jgi:hypothetical protein
MCANTDLQLPGVGENDNTGTTGGQSAIRRVPLNDAIGPSATASPDASPHSPRSSHRATVSADSKSPLGENEEGNGNTCKNDASELPSSSSSRRTESNNRHKRRPSVVQSDDGMDEGCHPANVTKTTTDKDDDSNRSVNSVSKDNNIFCMELVLPSVCQGGANFAENLDIFMTCRHPLDLLGMFHEEEDQDFSRQAEVAENDVVRVSGYYAIPTTCEYCGSPRLEDCDPGRCQRPASFFPKQRPPFCKRGGKEWDSKDCAVIILNSSGDGDDNDDDNIWNDKAPGPPAEGSVQQPQFRFHVPGFFATVAS